VVAAASGPLVPEDARRGMTGSSLHRPPDDAVAAIGVDGLVGVVVLCD
jgi:hypothetical protein